MKYHWLLQIFVYKYEYPATSFPFFEKEGSSVGKVENFFITKPWLKSRYIKKNVSPLLAKPKCTSRCSPCPSVHLTVCPSVCYPHKSVS